MRAQGTTRSTRRNGAAAIELAILAPFLLLILFGIIEFGWLFMARQMVHHATSEATRLCHLVGYDCVGNSSAQAEAAAVINDALEPLNLGSDLAFGSGIEADMTDGVISITTTVQLSDLLLAGLLAHIMDPDGTEMVEFTVSMAHQAP
jgi:hypothetical protein